MMKNIIYRTIVLMIFTVMWAWGVHCQNILNLIYNFKLCFAKLADQYAFNFAGVIECPESLCTKLESGFYVLDPDALYQRADDSPDENMVELLGIEWEVSFYYLQVGVGVYQNIAL